MTEQWVFGLVDTSHEPASPGVQGAGHSPPNHTAHIEPNTIIHSGQCQPHSLHSVEPATVYSKCTTQKVTRIVSRESLKG